jgi:trehalose 6-phosphate synthase
MGRTFVVSNRNLGHHGAEQTAGGLAVALKSVLHDHGGVWLGWSGRVRESANEASKTQERGSFTLATFDLSASEYNDYYLGFANRVLWPALHSRIDLMRFRASEYAAYASVNEKFAHHLMPLLGADDLVWVHDYHLMMLARELRTHGIKLPLGFFLHVPFPAADAMATIPRHIELMTALTAYDLLGFQSRNDLTNFSDYVTRYLGGTTARDGTVHALGRRFRAATFPIGIDVKARRTLADSPDVQRLALGFRSGLQGGSCIVGVDRLDYTKGLSHRLEMFERFLQRAPGYRRRAFLLQIAAPSRDTIPDYANHKAELESLAGRINSQYGEVDWTPVRYVNKTFSHSELAAIFGSSRIGLVTPLRDGMNLVAKEYVAAQDPADPGVLVLSCFAGAAEQLKSALIVNPYDLEGTAEILCRAMAMPLDERRARWSKAIAQVQAHDIHEWRRRFLSTLQRAACESASGKRTAVNGSATSSWPHRVGQLTPRTLTHSRASSVAPSSCDKAAEVLTGATSPVEVHQA